MTTLPENKAKDLASALVLKKYAACVNMVPGVQSFYFWEGDLRQDHEVVLLIKTHENKLSFLLDFLQKEHPYSVPELIVFEKLSVNSAYLEWLKSYVAQD